VRGVLHRPGFQAVFVDTPDSIGPGPPWAAVSTSRSARPSDDVDVVVPVLDATASIGPRRPVGAATGGSVIACRHGGGRRTP